MRHLSQRLVLLAALLAGLDAHAAGLFRPPGQIDLPPLPWVLDAGTVLTEDTQGALYLDNRSCQATPGGPWRTWADSTPPGSGGTEVWGASPVHDGVVGLRLQKMAPDEAHPKGYEQVQILRVRCADIDPKLKVGSAIQVVAQGERDLPPGVTYAPDTGPPIAAADGTVCQARKAGLWCAKPTATGLQQELRIAFGTLDAQLGLPPQPAIDQASQPVTWLLGPAVWTPDNRLFVLAARTIFYPKGALHTYGDTGWLLESLPGGQVVARLAPPGLSGAKSAFDEANQIVYLPQLKALALFPVVQQGDYSHLQVPRKGGNGSGTGVDIDLGATGVGMWLVHLQGPGNGFLSLTDAVARRRSCNTASWNGLMCESAWGPATIWPRPATAAEPSGVGVLLPSTNFLAKGNVEKHMHTHALTLQAADVDLDQDGLSAAEEAAHGSSDWLDDSDGGGTCDTAEVHLAQSQPQVTKDDPWLTHLGPKGRYALVGSRLMIDLHGIGMTGQRVQTWGVAGPLCVAGTCRDVDGEVVATYVPNGKVPHAETKAADGSHLVQLGAAGYERLRWDGVREMAAPMAEVLALLPPQTSEPGELRAMPADLDTLFVMRESHTARVAVFERGQPGRVVFDLQKERCASGLGPCSDKPGKAESGMPVHDLVRDEFRVLGWDPQTRRLLLSVVGVWDVYILGVHATQPPVVLRRGRHVGGLPGWIAPTGHGDLMSDGGLMDSYFSFRPTYLGTGVPGSNPQLLGAWGHTALRVEAGTLLEMVRYEPGVAPGDVLFLARLPNSAPMLYVSKPRGGLVPLWDAPIQRMLSIDGMDVTADLRLCVADRKGRKLWEFSAGLTAVPDVPELEADVGELVDCKYDGAGDLHLLLADPPRIEVRHGLTGDSVLLQTLPADKHPQQLVKKPDGSLEVLYTEEGLRGRLYTKAGRKVEMAQGSFDLTVAGVPMGPVGLWWINKQSTQMEKKPGRVALVERADGVLLFGGTGAEPTPPYALIAQVFAIEPRTRGFSQPWLLEHYAHDTQALAVVPGGLAVDPWTQRPVPDPAPQVDVAVPVAPTPPKGGKQVAAAPVADQGGCQAGRPGGAGGGIGLLVGWLLALVGLRRVAWRGRSADAWASTRPRTDDLAPDGRPGLPPAR